MQTFNLENSEKNIEVLIFDIDSTLYTCPEYAREQIDSQIRHFSKLRGISADEGRSKVAEFRKKWAAENGGRKISLGNLLTNFGISIETSIEWRKTLFDPKDYLKKDDLLIKAISDLKSRFYLICVTNNPVVQGRRTLEALGISTFIPEIIGLDTLKLSKPDERIFNEAIRKASAQTGKTINAENCVSIGDRFDIDLALPLKMGMGAILVNGVEDVYKIPEIL